MEDMLSANSAYLKEDYLKRKFMAVWDELCEMQGIPSTIEIEHDDGLDENYSSSPYPEVNRRVRRLLKRNEFPDHMDVCDLINRCNEKYNLGISVAEKTELSRRVFKEVGEIIKRRRVKDYRAHFGSHLTDAVKDADDPAGSDEALLEQLKKSLHEGHQRMESLVEEFVVKQEQEGEKGDAEEGEGQQNESSGDEEEEEEEEETEEVEVTIYEKDSGGEEEGAALSADEEVEEEVEPPAAKVKKLNHHSPEEVVSSSIKTTPLKNGCSIADSNKSSSSSAQARRAETTDSMPSSSTAVSYYNVVSVDGNDVVIISSDDSDSD